MSENNNEQTREKPYITGNLLEFKITFKTHCGSNGKPLSPEKQNELIYGQCYVYLDTLLTVARGLDEDNFEYNKELTELALLFLDKMNDQYNWMQTILEEVRKREQNSND